MRAESAGTGVWLFSARYTGSYERCSFEAQGFSATSLGEGSMPIGEIAGVGSKVIMIRVSEIRLELGLDVRNITCWAYLCMDLPE
jgi:hypothetical protein